MASPLETVNRPYKNITALAYTGTAATSAVLIQDDQSGFQVQLCPTTTCFIEIGPNPTATANSLRLPADTIQQFILQALDKVSVIRETTSGTLSITIMR